MTSNHTDPKNASNTATIPLRIPLLESGDSDSDNPPKLPPLPQQLIDTFQSDGFVIFPDVVSLEAVQTLNDRLEDVLRGVYDRGVAPDKTPRLIKGKKPEMDALAPRKGVPGPLGFSGNLQNVKVLQIINIHKADSLFRKLETDLILTDIVAQLAGWECGARLAQDQVWAKPPGSPPLVFHRDSPYFMFDPDDVVTVWFALDDMDPELGPLEYVRGSQLWGDGRVGSAQQFFQANVKRLLQSAAEREGLDPDSLDIVSMAGLKSGGLSIHNGKIWHGSGKNDSKTRPRRGVGMHFVPANVRFTAEACHSRLWKSYVEHADDPTTVQLPVEDFPLPSYQ